MVKDNYESIKNDAEYIENKVPHELENFVENVLKTSYQYLELILDNPKEQIGNSNFNLDAIRGKLRQFLEPKKEKKEELEIEKRDKEEEEEEPIETPEEESKGTLGDMSELEEKSVVTLDDIAKLEDEVVEDTLKIEDNTEIAREYSVEDEIQGLKDIVSYLNDKNQFKKALIYQRRLVKLAREKNVKVHEETDLKQRTLSDF